MDEKIKRWEHFPHGADVGIRGIGKNIEDAFEMGAFALIALVAESNEIKSSETVEVHCQAPNQEILFFDWINALIYEMATKNMVFTTFEVRIENNSLRARVSGESIDINKHTSTVEPKGATMTELKVHRQGDVWVAQCIVDV